MYQVILSNSKFKIEYLLKYLKSLVVVTNFFLVRMMNLRVLLQESLAWGRTAIQPMRTNQAWNYMVNMCFCQKGFGAHYQKN